MTKQNSHLKFPARPPSMNWIHRNSVPSVFLNFGSFWISAACNAGLWWWPWVMFSS